MKYKKLKGLLGLLLAWIGLTIELIQKSGVHFTTLFILWGIFFLFVFINCRNYFRYKSESAREFELMNKIRSSELKSLLDEIHEESDEELIETEEFLRYLEKTPDRFYYFPSSLKTKGEKAHE